MTNRMPKIVFMVFIIIFLLYKLMNENSDVLKVKTFVVDTPIQSYQATMSQYPGFPFCLQCDFKEQIDVEVSSGYLLNSTGIQASNKLSMYCGETIYWNFVGEYPVEEVQIRFRTDLHTQDFTLIRNENYEYSLKR